MDIGLDRLHKLEAALDRFKNAQENFMVHSSQATINISGGGLTAIIVALIGVFGIVVALSVLYADREIHDRDMREMGEIKQQLQAIREIDQTQDAYINTFMREKK